MSIFSRFLDWLLHRRPKPKPVPIPPAPTPTPPPPPPPPPVPVRRVPLVSEMTRPLDATVSFWGMAPWKDPAKEATMWPLSDGYRIKYETQGTGLESSDQNIEFLAAKPLRYNEPFLLRGKVTLHGTPANNANTRKLMDVFSGGEPHPRVIAHRTNGKLGFAVGQYESAGDWAVDVTQGETAIDLLDEVEYELGLLVLPNSADNVRDGVMQLFVDDMTKPAFSLSGLMPITDRDGVLQSFFNSFRFGSQYTGQPGEPAVVEYRDWRHFGVFGLAA